MASQQSLRGFVLTFFRLGEWLHILLLPACWDEQSLIGLLGVIGAFFTSDLFGRRPLALGAGVILSSSLFIIAIMSVIPDTTARSTVLSSFMCLWSFGYNSGIAPIGESYRD
jgi:hypothetical protein